MRSTNCRTLLHNLSMVTIVVNFDRLINYYDKKTLEDSTA